MKMNLSNRISLGYIAIITTALIGTGYCIYTLQSNKKLSMHIQEVNLPIYLKLKDVSAMNNEALKLINNWIYQPTPSEKQALTDLQALGYPRLRSEIRRIVERNQDTNIDSVTTLLGVFDRVIGTQREIMKILNADSLYSNDAAVDRAISLNDGSVVPGSKQLSTRLDHLLKQQEAEIDALQLEKEAADSFLSILLVVMIVIFIGAAVGGYFYARKTIIEPIVLAKDYIVSLGQGRLTNIMATDRNDEIGEMMTAMQNLTGSMNAKSRFALAIGQGRYDEQFQLLSEEDVIGRALLDMRESLKKNANDEWRRNWVTQGLAEVGTILRNHTDNPTEFYNVIIRFVVKYSEANQGGIFLVASDEQGDRHLDLMACYAYDRKKYMEKKVMIGEGILGQCVLEKRTVHLSEIPRNYISITSGLGDAPPSNLVIVPLKVNEDVVGVMEIASFKKFEKFQIELFERLAESIAAAIANVQVNRNTRTLLEQSRQQADEMKSSQEELKQSMEELSAIQEEMTRKEKEYVRKIALLEEAIRSHSPMPSFEHQ